MLFLSIKTAFSSNNSIQRIINRAFGKGCVEVQLMVAAVVVMLTSAVVCSVACVPNIRQSRHNFRFFCFEIFQ